ncbi:MAG TPA: 16S rRNA (cytosine(1402)-N(4))-methyltransferase RsmH [Candidatus Saccharimonadales bacterium]|nr:16S rRNA (cytosine(1402)-N(4))-methyltransferase RsmH [Candidatus Saccharimonadales bacterium]
MLKHQPVLLKEVLEYLQPKTGKSYLDVTAGYGGHAAKVIEKTRNSQKVVLVDRDIEAVRELEQLFKGEKVRILHQDFLSASQLLQKENRKFDMILADLGTSSQHFDSTERGFSIKHSGPLDMRMDSRQELTASDVVNSTSESELVDIFTDYEEEPKARQIAQKIVRRRPIKTTDQLAAIAVQVWSGKSRIHPATRIFQALRIFVNDELKQLEKAMPIWLELLNNNGRIVIISFHSLEDRLVKHFLNEHSNSNYGGELKILTTKPVVATKDEIASNPRARSAKLRAAAK